jgi:hypothetical protein
MSGRFGQMAFDGFSNRLARARWLRLAHDVGDDDYLQRGNESEKRRTRERTSEFNGKQGERRPKHSLSTHANNTSGSASDASASAGLDLRYDAADPETPWCVVVWPKGEEKRFETKQEAHDFITGIDDDTFWDEGNGASRNRDRVRVE